MFSLSEILSPATPTIDLLDIGAMVEGAPRYIDLFNAGAINLTLVEPNKNEIDLVRKAYGEEPRLLDCFLGDGNPATLHLTHYPGCVSMFEPDPAIINKFESIDTREGSNFHVKSTEPIETKRLDDVTPRVDADFIKIDVQGSELVILENAIETLKGVSVIETEAEFIPIYKGQPLFGDLQVFMRDQGFVLHKFVDVASRCFSPLYFNDNIRAGMSQLMWSDAIFVRDFSDMSVYSDEALLKAAYVMHDVYNSYDFVYFLLNEYDTRLETTYALPYAQKLATYPDLPKLLLNFKE